jgi:hypothetical protein
MLVNKTREPPDPLEGEPWWKCIQPMALPGVGLYAEIAAFADNLSVLILIIFNPGKKQV